MVRWVFRPFTHIRRSICTSESLRASTRVSSGFAMYKQRSQHLSGPIMCAPTQIHPKKDRSTVHPLAEDPICHFHFAFKGFLALILAYMLDSLVRVSRRGGWSHYVNIPRVEVKLPSPQPSSHHTAPKDRCRKPQIKGQATTPQKPTLFPQAQQQFSPQVWTARKQSRLPKEHLLRSYLMLTSRWTRYLHPNH